MSAQSPTGFALVLVLCGSLIATVGSVASLVAHDHRLMGIAAAGFAVQFLGWKRHARRNGGAS
ncbi:hypothetical protein [Streptomyces albicerus]|uniref:hypothetical protein n=1 Tax=Streptomyces albicerus TaxID=2569859 RepID=UPI00124BB227|nr:hypothetical protein [Streptomyces albicerus]